MQVGDLIKHLLVWSNEIAVLIKTAIVCEHGAETASAHNPSGKLALRSIAGAVSFIVLVSLSMVPLLSGVVAWMIPLSLVNSVPLSDLNLFTELFVCISMN